MAEQKKMYRKHKKTVQHIVLQPDWIQNEHKKTLFKDEDYDCLFKMRLFFKFTILLLLLFLLPMCAFALRTKNVCINTDKR